jgi:hypothetical protein
MTRGQFWGSDCRKEKRRDDERNILFGTKEIVMKWLFQKTSLSNLAISKASKVGGYLIKYQLGKIWEQTS